MQFDFIIFATTFLLIFLAELPDKSLMVTVVLSTKQPRSAVWLGAAIAFGIQATIAVTAGALLTSLPETLVLSIVLAIFTLGALFLFRSAWQERAKVGIDTEEISQAAIKRSWISAVALTFGVVFTAEWGDLTQLTAAARAAETGNPLSVGLGAWGAEIVVAAIGVWVGYRIKDKLKPATLHLFTGSLLSILAVLTIVELVTN